MDKLKIDNDSFTYPMPVTLVGTKVDDRPNFMAVAWLSKVNYKPLMVGVVISKGHHTHGGIVANKTFSVNLPGKDLVEKTDYCGLISGRDADKSRMFDIFYGELGSAPMIKECPLCIECKLVETVSVPGDSIFIGEVIGTYIDKRYLTDGKPDMDKMKPFLLTMPDMNYRTLGEIIAGAWQVGKKFMDK
jgi:flavin reductase (DIM6/NTAB) family NADH-FMN oxidoreductase RutF